MSKALGAFLCIGIFAFAGCAEDPQGHGLRRGAPGTPSLVSDNPSSPAPSKPAAETSAALSACGASPTPTQLSNAKDARDVHLAGNGVFFTSAAGVFRVAKDATGLKQLYASPNLVRSFVDPTTMILIESTGTQPEATLRVVAATTPASPEGAPEFPAQDGANALGSAAATNYNAAGTYVFASDATSFYLLADTTDGETIYKVDKANPATRTAISQTANRITDPQVSGGAIWYVRDQQRIFKVMLADPENGIAQGEPTEVFGIGYASCSLAVNTTSAFCSVGSAVERRDLTGGNATTILDAAKSTTQARFGATTARDGTLYVRSDAPDADVKYVIRSINATSAAEGLVACGRNAVSDLDVDGTSVVWSEQDQGVFIAPR